MSQSRSSTEPILFITVALEDEWGMLTDVQLKERFDHHYPDLANVVRVAGRGQQWHFS